MPFTAEEIRLANQCLNCPVCGHARRKQHGLAFLFVKYAESSFCPACQAFEKVYGQKAHEPVIGDLKQVDTD